MNDDLVFADDEETLDGNGEALRWPLLIVDDEESDRLIAQAILAKSGHETYFASDGDEALRLLAKYTYDVVLTDLQMPQVHGFELISVLRELDRRPALVVMSSTGPFQLHMAEALGAKGFRVTTPDKLRPAIEKARESGVCSRTRAPRSTFARAWGTARPRHCS